MSDRTADRPTIYHIPVCPFSQRVEVLLTLKGVRDAVDFHTVDITRPYPDWLTDLTGGVTAMPFLRDEQGRMLNESRVLVRYIDERFGPRPVARTDAYERAVERLMIRREGPLADAGYWLILNVDRAKQAALTETLLAEYRWLNDFLMRHSPHGTWLFDGFGLAETVFAPLFQRFWVLHYYDGFELPDGPAYDRVRRWSEACLAHPAVRQVSYEEIVKIYYDYAVGVGNGGLPRGRRVSSVSFEPDWRGRPMPPRDTYDRIATDEELGLA